MWWDMLPSRDKRTVEAPVTQLYHGAVESIGYRFQGWVDSRGQGCVLLGNKNLETKTLRTGEWKKTGQFFLFGGKRGFQGITRESQELLVEIQCGSRCRTTSSWEATGDGTQGLWGHMRLQLRRISTTVVMSCLRVTSTHITYHNVSGKPLVSGEAPAPRTVNLPWGTKFGSQHWKHPILNWVESYFAMRHSTEHRSNNRNASVAVYAAESQPHLHSSVSYHRLRGRVIHMSRCRWILSDIMPLLLNGDA